MANQVKQMHIVRTIIQLLDRKESERSIARQVKISRNTIRLYAQRCRNSSYSFGQLLALDDATLGSIVYIPTQSKPAGDNAIRTDFTSRIQYFLTELKRTGVTRFLLWQEYKKQQPEGYGYSRFCELFLRYTKVQDPSMHFEYTAGEQMMMDFAGDKLYYTDRQSGEIIGCPVLVCILPFSGYSYVRALPNATLPQLVKALNKCLTFFGGVPQTLKTDNMKQVVQKSCRYEPVFTDMMQQWAQHNNITLLAARAGKPKDKAPVENQVKLTYQRIYAPLRDQVFFSLEELNGAVDEQLKVHHQMPMQKKEDCRFMVFEHQEKSLLQPLPQTLYCLKHQTQAKVQRNYHITLGEDWHHYSVPCQYIGKTLRIIYDSDMVQIYYLHDRICMHKRNYKKHGYTTCKDHMPESHQKVYEQRGWNEDYFLDQAQKIGTHTYQFIDGLLKSRHFTQQSYNACLGILRLARAYGPERLEAACRRALQGNSYSYRTVYNILAGGLDKEPLPAPTNTLFQLPPHDNLRGSAAYG